MAIKMPRMFDTDRSNIHVIERDEMPTQRPFEHAPAYTPPPPPPLAKLPLHVSHEMLVAKEIFAELLNMKPDGRDRVMHMTADLLRLYAEKEGEHPEGSPV
jgi:hypothetical protein